MNDIELKRHLVEWAQAYGGAQFKRLGYAGNEALKCPQAEESTGKPGSVAEQIETSVRLMEECGRWREGRVIRVEYFMAALPEAERLDRLKRVGVQLSRAAYYTYLNAARTFVLGAISSVTMAPRA